MTMRLVRDDDHDSDEPDTLPGDASVLDLAKLATNESNTIAQIEDLSDAVKFLHDHSVKQLVELYNYLNELQDHRTPELQATGRLAIIGFCVVCSQYVKEKDGPTTVGPTPRPTKPAS